MRDGFGVAVGCRVGVAVGLGIGVAVAGGLGVDVGVRVAGCGTGAAIPGSTACVDASNGSSPASHADDVAPNTTLRHTIMIRSRQILLISLTPARNGLASSPA